MRIAILSLIAALLCAGEASLDPSKDETEILLLLNSHRTERRLVDNKLNQLITTGKVEGSVKKWAHRGSTANQPAMVVNPALMQVARDLLKAGTRQKPLEFLNPKAAMTAAGYAAVDGLAFFAHDRPDHLNAYATAMLNVIDLKRKDVSSEVYAAQFALKPEWREVGIAVATGKGGLQLVMVLGPGTAKRHIGGMVYNDANRNRECDAGEGVAGITVSCGDKRMTTGSSGAYWLTQDASAAGSVAFEGGGFAATRAMAKGEGNPGIDWRMPSAADIKAADPLISAAEQVASDPAKRRSPLASLLCATRMSAFDDAREQRIAKLVEPLLPEYDSALDTVFSTIAMDAGAARQAFANLQKDWKQVAPAWYAEAEGLSRLGQQITKARTAERTRDYAALLKQVQKAKGDSLEPRFLQQYLIWEEQLSEAPPAEDPAAKKKPGDKAK